MAVGGDRAQCAVLGGPRRMQIDTVEIVARFFRRDRELGTVDQPLHVGGAEREGMGHVAGGEIGEIAFRQGLQREARAPGADCQHGAVAVALQHDLRAVRQLAHDVIEHVRGHGGGAAGGGFGGERFGDFEIEVGGFQAEARLVGADQHVAEDRNRIPPFDHAVNVAQRFQELRALDGNLHDNSA